MKTIMAVARTSRMTRYWRQRRLKTSHHKCGAVKRQVLREVKTRIFEVRNHDMMIKDNNSESL